MRFRVEEAEDEAAFFVPYLLLWLFICGLAYFIYKAIFKERPRAVKYFVFAIITLVAAIYVDSKFEGGSFIIVFAFWGILSIIASYDVCRSRGRELTSLLFPLFLGWIGFFIVLLCLRRSGEKEYPFQKIF